MTAGWPSGMRSRLRKQRTPVVSRGFCDQKLHLLTSTSCIYVHNINQYNLYIEDLCMSIRYLVSITQVLKDT
jgi:hypothetical protein